MAKAEDTEGFLHEHRKELAIGGVAALGALGLIFTLARQRLRELDQQSDVGEEPNDNS